MLAVMNATHAAPLKGPPQGRDLRAQRFADLIRYAQRVCGRGDSSKASQRELAERIEVAGTMITRYLSGTVDWSNIKTQTARLIADAAEMDVGSIYVWIENGREAAFRHEAQIRSRPVSFGPLELARELTAMLEQQGGERSAGPDYRLVREKLVAVEGESPRLFSSLVGRIGAEGALAKLEFGHPLTEEEWQQINTLLGEEKDQEQCSPNTETRTSPLPA
jgi:transcriptional regulator with XRE-family HTH domain